jgi:hypothetical protein
MASFGIGIETSFALLFIIVVQPVTNPSTITLFTSPHMEGDIFVKFQ